jgi:hypothetical protein
MGGLARAVGRLLIMGAVMAGVVVAGLVAGIGTTIALALGILLAGVVGLAGAARRGSEAPATAPIAQAAVAQGSTPGSGGTIEAMEPAGAMIDPEANMPRWRRPSLLEARHSDPRQRTVSPRAAQRFSDHDPVVGDLRQVRYAVVPVLDQPDEVVGLRLSDLGHHDEVQVVGAAGTFLEVVCPNGIRGWIHRTTVSQPVTYVARPSAEPEADDVLTALLAARGLQ